MVIRVFRSLLLINGILFSAFAQQPQQPPSTPPSTQSNPRAEVDSQDVIKITTNLVQVDVSVTKDGKPVTDLGPEDFEIFSDGKLQQITNFSYISNIPGAGPATTPAPAKTRDKIPVPVAPARITVGEPRRTVALLIDDLGMSFTSIADVRRQLRKFIDEQLGPNDLIAIIRTGGDVGALQQFTNDKRVLIDAINHIRWNLCSRAGVNVFEQVGVPSVREVRSPFDYGPCGTSFLDSTTASLRIFEFVLGGMRALPGRKSMVIFSDNLPISTHMAEELSDPPVSLASALTKVAEQAIRSAVVIYAVDTRGLQYTGPTAADQVRFPSRSAQTPDSVLIGIANRRAQALIRGREGSDLLSRKTGGFLIANSNDFGLKQIMNDQQGYYLIGFRPAEDTFNKSFHRLKASVKRSGVTVRTRSGFYGFSDDEARAVRMPADDEMKAALLTPFSAQDINLRLTSFFVDDPKDGPTVRSFLYLNPHDLVFSESDGWQVTNLKIESMVFGDNGKPIAREERTGTIRFRNEGYERALREGFSYTFDFPVKVSGAFQVRVAVRDEKTSRIGSAGQFVELPNLASGRLAMSGIVARVFDDKAGQELAVRGPGLRQFHQDSAVTFEYSIYNANRQGRAPELTAQIRLFRDARVVFTGAAVPLNLAGQNDPQRLTNVLKFELGSKFEPGNYICQIVVTDLSDKEKPRVASQWIDLEIVK